MGLFSRKESAEPPLQQRCEMCELLLCGYVTGLEKQLQAAMWVDRSFRFGDQLAVAIAQLETQKQEVEKLWQNYRAHSSEHHC